MKDPLESSRRMIAQARKHILDLDKQIKIFNEAVPETVTAEADPQIEHKQPYHIKFAKVVPSSLAETVSDIAGNLRAALDQAGYAVAVASGKAVPKYCAFPFAGSATEFENALNGRAKDLPQQIRALLRAFKPYMRRE